MSTFNSEEKLQQFARKLSDLFFGFKVITFLFLLVASTGNIVAALSIDSFQQIFADALPGKPLPGITLFVIDCKTIILPLAFIWPMVGLAALFIRERIRVAIGILALALVLTLLQSGLVVLAMRMPMIGLINGMSDSHP